MKNIIIAFQLTKRRKWSLLFLAIEIIISMIVIISMVGQLIYEKNTEEISGIFQGMDCYYFSPYDYYSSDFEIGDYLEKETVEIGNMYFLTVNGENENNTMCMKGCSDMILERLNIPLTEGEWFKEGRQEEIHLIAVGEKYSVGEELSFGNKKGKVIGTVSEDEYMISFSSGASNGHFSLGNIVSNLENYQFLVPYNSMEYPCLEEKDTVMAILEPGYMIQINESQKREEILSVLKDYGSISSIQEMNDNYDNEKREFYITNGIVMVIFVLLTLVGIGGMNGIQRMENEKYYTIMYMLGVSPLRCMVIEAMNSFAVIGVSYAIFLLLNDWIIAKSLPYNMADEYGWIYLLLFLYLLGLYMITSFSGIKKASKRNLIELYKG